MKRVKILRSQDRRVRVISNTQYSEGDVVDTPDGLGVVIEVRTASFDGPDEDEVEASEDSPAYVVGLENDDDPVGVYRASDLESDELPETDVDDPVKDVNGEQSSNSMSANDWSMPRSWREAETPSRLILLDAWASMGGQFDCGGSCCMGELKSARLCGAMKDEVLGGWTGWR